MDKQQKIHNAWSDLGIIFLLSEYDFNGWSDVNNLSKKQLQSGNLDFIIQEETLFETQKIFCRPKLLSGIENNNGWNKISEVGYPKDDSFDYHVINFDFPKTIEIALRQEVDKRFTHWRIIPNPINPIY